VKWKIDRVTSAFGAESVVFVWWQSSALFLDMHNPFSAQSLSVQRPRLPRPASLQFGHDSLSDVSQAGPSRTSISMHDADSGTPQSSSFTANVFPHNSYSENNTSADTPAARLRALLSRIPNTSPPNASGPPPPHQPLLSTTSEVESESELQYSPAASRSTRESLKNLFSRALREPGDTPRKERQRRNSVDVSEVEATPRVEMERAKNKGKRKSMSDEEAERQYSACFTLKVMHRLQLLRQGHHNPLKALFGHRMLPHLIRYARDSSILTTLRRHLHAP
jgi:hypothetical protein